MRPPPRAIPVPGVVQRLPGPGAPSPLAGWRGANPYGEFARSFTDAGGIRLAFKIKDAQAWRLALRIALWLLAMAVTLWFALRASPYPLAPRGCPLFGPCPVRVPPLQVAVNLVLLLAMAVVYALILFVDDQTMASIEIRKDCMIVDDADVFWSDRMDLGWPQIVPAGDGSFVLRGVYGTREIDYVTLHAFDEKDRAIQVLGAQLQFAMQQLWAQPGGGR